MPGKCDYRYLSFTLSVTKKKSGVDLLKWDHFKDWNYNLYCLSQPHNSLSKNVFRDFIPSLWRNKITHNICISDYLNLLKFVFIFMCCFLLDIFHMIFIMYWSSIVWTSLILWILGKVSQKTTAEKQKYEDEIVGKAVTEIHVKIQKMRYRCIVEFYSAMKN